MTNTHYSLRQLIKTDVVSAKRLVPLTDEAQQIKMILAAIINSARDGDSPGDKPGER